MVEFPVFASVVGMREELVTTWQTCTNWGGNIWLGNFEMKEKVSNYIT